MQRDAILVDLRAAIGAHAKPMIVAALTVLEGVLTDRSWLVGECFSVADLHVAAVLSPSRAAEIDFSAHQRTRDWLTRCYARPAAVMTRQRFQD